MNGMTEVFFDKEFGDIYIKRNMRARNIIARKRNDYIELTVPSVTSIGQIIAVFEQMKPRLQSLKSKPQFILDPSSVINTMSFSVCIESLNVKNYHATLRNKVLHIICPHISDFSNPNVQATLKNAIENTMRNEAKRIFPSKLLSLADIHGFKYKSLSINKSRTRWGSCSSKSSINLSYFCLFLPEYLIDFVMLHELCHTIEMNHGEKFWMLLNKVTDNKARRLTAELKKIIVPW